MFATGIILALILGFFIGITTAVTIALYWDEIEKRKEAKKKAAKFDEAVKIVNEYEYIPNN